MSPTRRLRSLLAGTRRGPVSVLSVMFVALALVSVHVLCSVHLDQGGAGHGHGEVSAATAAAAAVVPGTESEPLGDESHGCGDHHSASAQCDPLVPSPVVSAVLPERTVQRTTPAAAYLDHRTPDGVATPVPPSLHALGISRT
ncbi:hypothetical protein [Promicromonospora sukumoe]|uniref:hypothetical protein n=1 Tax=Promicromonospora sukumoe TaxID=88382 RepID=UPI0004784F44|nr:hypothetical protein [Promicromonospora sukumoe]